MKRLTIEQEQAWLKQILDEGKIWVERFQMTAPHIPSVTDVFLAGINKGYKDTITTLVVQGYIERDLK